MIALGIDEAGRGAVLGPLVVAGVAVPEEALDRLSLLGARDSKAVPRGRRREILAGIARAAWVRTVVIPARAVDEGNLTQLELAAAAQLVRRAISESPEPAARHAPDLAVVMDAPVGPRAIPGFVTELARRSGLPGEAIAAYPKADAHYPAVAAASLAAKVVRDAYVAFLRGRYGDFGWGYPGERRVREFLEDWLARYGGLPPICRTRWRSVARLRAGRFPL